MFWLWLGLGFLGGIALLLLAGWLYLFYHIKWNFLGVLIRIFQEKPLFIIPKGQPVADAEEVTIPTTDGLKLAGCYLRSAQPQRRGVILFGLEFGSNRWSCVAYTQFLRDAGFDIFAVEPRSQGDSDRLPGYEPLQWVTDYEVDDCRAALSYLKSRPDADPSGIGFFGISKGGGAGLIAAANDPFVRCFVTDGAFAAYTTMVPYERKWIAIYSHRKWLFNNVPDWYYGMFARMGLKRIEQERHCRFPHLENYIGRLAPRPLLMIHGGADTYIKPEMGQALFRRARQPKELWVVEGAKHNLSYHTARQEYERRVLSFFLGYLNDSPEQSSATANGKSPQPKRAPEPAGKP